MSFSTSAEGSAAVTHRAGTRATTLERASVLVIDDHPMMRDGLVNLINLQDNLICCAEAANAAQAQLALSAHKPRLAILDLRLGNSDGLELIKTLIARQPDLKILILSQHGASIYVERALRAGASGYVLKEQAADELLNAIRTVLAGELYLPRGVAASLLGNLAVKRGALSPETKHLTDRELHVLHLLGDGLSTREIADELQLSLKTIETHRENLKSKLQLRSASELIHFACGWAREHVAILPNNLNA